MARRAIDPSRCSDAPAGSAGQVLGSGDSLSHEESRMSIVEGVPWNRSDFPYLTEMTTRWADNDHYQHLNNLTHYSLFDSAINAYLIEATQVDIRDLPGLGILVETGCRFLAPLSFPQRLTVGVAVTRLGERSVRYRPAIFAPGCEEPSAVGHFVHAYVDRHEQSRSVPVPGLIRAAVAPLVVTPPDAR
jgi:acyl-CoA thioester hydrolase